MADPSSVSASIFGILLAGGKIIALLTEISRLSDAPPTCKAALTEVCDISIALRQFQSFLADQSTILEDRRQHVLIEQLGTALTGCVMIMDDLATICDDLGLMYAEDGTITVFFNPMKWDRKEEKIKDLILRLQNHKASLNLMFTIGCGAHNTKPTLAVAELNPKRFQIHISGKVVGSTVKVASGFDVSPTETVEELKQRLWDRGYGLPPDRTVLFYASRARSVRLVDAKTLAENGVPMVDRRIEGTIHVLLKFRCGGTREHGG